MPYPRLASIVAAALVAASPVAAGQALATDCLTAACASADPRARDNRAPRVRDHRTRMSYTIHNDTRQVVSFKLPSGRTYRLKPGQRGSYSNSAGGRPKIFVNNSGRTYTLRSGNHRFWWMSEQTRVGLDLNYRR